MFSVVIPLYNKEVSINKTINAVLNQSFGEFEIVIVNDGSTDGSLELVQSIHDTRIRIFTVSNGGVSAARNFGVSKAKYDWIAFLDADDTWLPCHLEEFTKMMKQFSTSKIFASSFEFSDRRTFQRYPRLNDHTLITDYFQQALIEPVIWTSAVLINKRFFLESGGFRAKLSRGEDLELWSRLAKMSRVVKSNKVTAFYEVETENKLTAAKSRYENSIVSVISLKGINGYERKYLKGIILHRLKENVRVFDIQELMKMIWRHNIELIK